MLQAGLLLYAGMSPQGILSPLEDAGWLLEPHPLFPGHWVVSATPDLFWDLREAESRDVRRGGRSTVGERCLQCGESAVLVGGKKGLVPANWPLKHAARVIFSSSLVQST